MVIEKNMHVRPKYIGTKFTTNLTALYIALSFGSCLGAMTDNDMAHCIQRKKVSMNRRIPEHNYI